MVPTLQYSTIFSTFCHSQLFKQCKTAGLIASSTRTVDWVTIHHKCCTLEPNKWDIQFSFEVTLYFLPLYLCLISTTYTPALATSQTTLNYLFNSEAGDSVASHSKCMGWRFGLWRSATKCLADTEKQILPFRWADLDMSVQCGWNWQLYCFLIGCKTKK